MAHLLTYSFRIKDSNEALKRELVEKAGAVNYVWNFCNETQLSALRKGKTPWQGPTAYDLMKLTSGCSKMLRLQATTIEKVCSEYFIRRQQFKKSRLNWRGKKSLNWIPFKGNAIAVNQESGTARYLSLSFNFWKSREIMGEIRTGSITSDNRGRWYLNLTCKVDDIFGPSKDSQVGIDLGLKDCVTMSNGVSVPAPRILRRYEPKLAIAQRARKTKQVKAIHKKIANSRKDFNQKLSNSIVEEFGTIIIGGVSSSKLAKTNMAKSVYDAGWFQLKTLLKYKALARGSTYKEVSEAYSTQICSECGCIPKSSPKGIRGLSVREWVCSDCGAKHHRDVNAAKNILRFGHESPPKLSKKPNLISRGISGL